MLSNFSFACSLVNPDTSIPSIFTPFVMFALFMFVIANITENIAIIIANTMLINFMVFFFYFFSLLFLGFLVFLVFEFFCFFVFVFVV